MTYKKTTNETLNPQMPIAFLPVVVKPRRIAGNDDVVGLFCDVIFTWIHGSTLVTFVRIFILLCHGRNTVVRRLQAGRHGQPSCSHPKQMPSVERASGMRESASIRE